jgi:hypothetical protein
MRLQTSWPCAAPKAQHVHNISKSAALDDLLTLLQPKKGRGLVMAEFHSSRTAGTRSSFATRNIRGKSPEIEEVGREQRVPRVCRSDDSACDFARHTLVDLVALI